MKYFFEIFAAISFLLGACSGARRKTQVRVRTIKFDCDHDSEISTDLVCKMAPLVAGGANLTFGSTLVKPVDTMLMVVNAFKKEGKGDYKPTIVSTKIELCEFFSASGTDNVIIQKLWPDVKKDFEKYIHPCPYTGTILVEDLAADGSMVSKFFPTGSYRVDYYLYNADNLRIFSLKYYFYINNFF